MRTGRQRIDRVIGKFTTLVDELDKGVEEVRGEIDYNTSVIEGLESKNTGLAIAVGTATNVANNLRKLIAG